MVVAVKRKPKTKRPKDLTGMRFGRLVAVSYHHSNKFGAPHWLCQCDCGKEAVRAANSLFTGTTESCGCAKGEKLRALNAENLRNLIAGRRVKDLTGSRFGRLVVVRYNGVTRLGSSTWMCQCDCGNTKIASSASLSKGGVKSCGCLRHQYHGHRLTRDEFVLGNRYKSYIRSAKSRALEFSLSVDRFWELINMPCHYCGGDPADNGAYNVNGIDRLDNVGGYTDSNSVPCCTPCNYAKGARSASNFAKWVTKVNNHFAANYSGSQPEGECLQHV